ncbi:MAG: NRDE family protein, partial [Cyclobacteriaceae bacterium]
GRDVRANGTWMAVNKAGRFSAVTNFRDLKNINPNAKSRGELPVNFLLENVSSHEYLGGIHKEAKAYNGFNLLTYENGKVFHYSNYEGKINELESGIYGLSNALLDTPWPKVKRLKQQFQRVIGGDFSHEDLLSLLVDPALASDEELPDTGVGHDMEKMLSAICIKSENYGTCCSTVLTISNEGELKFTERSYAVGNREVGEVSYQLQI